MPLRTFSVAEQSIHFLNRPTEAPPAGQVTGRPVWYGADLMRDTSPWSLVIPNEAITQFDELCPEDPYESAELSQVVLTPQPALDRLAVELRDRLQNGMGFVLVRGLPVLRWGRGRSRMFMWNLAVRLGIPGAQNPRGDLVGEVRHDERASADLNARNYVTDKEFRFHCDAADLVGLLCIRPAASGGQSRVCSSATVFNELRAVRPDLALRLFEPVLLDARNENGADLPPFAPVIPLAYSDGTLRTFYISDYFRSVERFKEVSLGREMLELFDTYEAIAARDDVCLEFQLQPGDLQLLNNHFTLHARSAFRDHPGPDAGRLLLRVLVSVPQSAATVTTTAPSASSISEVSVDNH